MYSSVVIQKLKQYFPHYALPPERVSRFLYVQSLLAVSTVFPFALWRVYQQQWMHATIDIVVLAVLFVLTLLAKKNTTRANMVAWVASGLYVVGIWLVVAHFANYTMLWGFPVIVALYFILSPRNAFLTNMILLIGIWVFIKDAPVVHEMVTYSIVVLLVNIFTLQFASRLYRDNEALALLSNLDPLTQVGNRRSLDARLTELYTSNQSDFSLMMMDLDHFKKVNDNHGHTVGDDLLQSLVAFINAYEESTLEVYRFGGEEFCLLLNKPLDEAVEWAKEICLDVEQAFADAEEALTVSIGVTEAHPKASVMYWLRSADEALYAAKHNGRNQVKVYRDGRIHS